MANHLQVGFKKADSHCLPKVDALMFGDYFAKADFLFPEGRNAKTLRSMRESYISTAFGYVQFRREGPICIVRAAVTPEYRVSSKSYQCKCIINEEEEVIVSAECESCKARLDNCKHSVALVSWLFNESQKPSVTEVQCYWKKSTLAAVASDQHSELLQVKTKKPLVVIAQEESRKTFELVSKLVKKTCPSAPLVKQITMKESLSLFQLMIIFTRTTPEHDHNAQNFKAFCTTRMSDRQCSSVARATIAQSECSLWFDVKYARISASKLYEASRCKTDGTLKNQIFGVVKIKSTEAMKRGLRLETSVLRALRKRISRIPKRTGFVMQGFAPIYGASPDALINEYVVEIKCPMAEKTFPSYFNPDLTEPANRYKAQINLQMHMCNKKKGLFCVADPNFEKNNKVTIILVNLDENFLKPVMNDAENYWDNYIFPVLYRAAAPSI